LDFVFCDLTVESMEERLIADGERIVRCRNPIMRMPLRTKKPVAIANSMLAASVPAGWRAVHQ
jgi:hypothetical protein